ncbi:20131_t:CDS:1, partial [Gigaspora rosea]
EIDSKELTTEKLELQYQYYRLIKTVITHFIPKSELNEYCYLEFRRKHQRIPTVEELLEGIYNNNKEYELAKTKEK